MCDTTNCNESGVASDKAGNDLCLECYEKYMEEPKADLSERVTNPVEHIVEPLTSVLTSNEVAFVATVFVNPGVKLDGKGVASHWEDDGTEYGKSISHWENPEALGLIECVGSYKWKPTDKLVLALEA